MNGGIKTYQCVACYSARATKKFINGRPTLCAKCFEDVGE
jgi:hypothetical protein